MDDEVKTHYKDFFVYIFIIILVFVGILFFFSKNNSPAKDTVTNEPSNSAKIKKYDSSPKMMIDQNKKYTALFTTSKGPITVELFAKETPVAVNNFIFLAKDGFYNGTAFHRIVKGFMIQGGDPKGDGTGGPGYKFDDEKITRDYKRGVVAMANSGSNTNGSQFFIMHKDYDLPKNYVIFGQVTKGLDIIDKIANVEVEDNGTGEKSKPKEKVSISKITITEK